MGPPGAAWVSYAVLIRGRGTRKMAKSGHGLGLAAVITSALMIPTTAWAPPEPVDIDDLDNFARPAQPADARTGLAQSLRTTACDTVTTVFGDCLTGNVIGTDAEGKLWLAAPHYQGEVRVLVSALDQVALACQHQESGDDQVALANGDRIAGEVLALTPELVILESGAAGPLKISRKVVSWIAFSRGRTILVDSNFERGQMEPWIPLGTSDWSVIDGALACHTSGSRCWIYAELQQKEAVTMEAKVEAVNGHSLYCELVLFADNKDSPYGGNSVFARFYSDRYYVKYARDGGTSTIVNRNFGRSVRAGVLRLAYDPESGKVRVWLDSTELGEYSVPNQPAGGRYVMFCTSYSCKISHMRVLRGILPDSGPEGQVDESMDIVEYQNKDRITALSMGLADGLFAAKTSYGELRCAVENVKSVVFRKNGQEEPRRRKGDVWVDTPDSRFTLQFEKLDGEYLVGSAEHLGRVKVLRSAVKGIRFNVYRQAEG